MDWQAIKNEYITTELSQRKLAEKYNVSPSTLRDRARREGWDKERRSVSSEVAQAAKEKAVDAAADRIEKLLKLKSKIIDIAAGKLNKSVDTLDLQRLTKIVCDLYKQEDIRDNEEIEDSGLLAALEAVALEVNDVDDSDMLPIDDEDDSGGSDRDNEESEGW